MTKKINLICLALALLISTAVICTAQSWGESSWGKNSGWTTGNNDVSDSTYRDGSGWTINNGNGNDQNTGSWGLPTPAEESEPNEGAYFPSSVSESSKTLIEETASYQFADVMGTSPMMAPYGGGGSSKNIFWIVSKDGTKHWISVNIPCQHYARLLIIPSTSGQLIMEELDPTGQVQTYNYGYVKAYKQYKKWFFADTSGTHQLRYRIDNGPYSDILTFHVGNCGGGGRICPCCGRPL